MKPPNLNPFAPGAMLELEPARKIQARHIRGRHGHWRWALVLITQLVFYGLPWLRWDGQPAVLFDLEARRFFLFGGVFFPQDLVWLTLLLVASALGLFFVTALAGRLWCGFACPQTVYTELFAWVEARCEGDRLARQRLDAAPWRADKLLRRGGKHLLWAALALWTGLSLVGYFTPIRALVAAAPAGWGPWESFWVLFYGLATYGNAGFLREKVCQHMCPYGRFQGSMLDVHTLNVSYDTARGEPRGGRARQADAQALGLGSCVDCTLCVQVCPVGIDIREGLQSACINCGVCIDACDTVMDKLGQPRGLLRFASLTELAGPALEAPPPLWRRLLGALRRPRAAVYAGLLGMVLLALAVGLWTRPTLRLDAMRDRSVLSRQVEDGAVENLYQLLVMNASGRPRRVQLLAQPASDTPGLVGLQLRGSATLVLAAAEARSVTVQLRVPPETAQALHGQIVPVAFVVHEVAPPAARAESARTVSTLVLPD